MSEYSNVPMQQNITGSAPQQKRRRDPQDACTAQLGDPSGSSSPPKVRGSRRGCRCGAARSRSRGQLKRADPDVGDTSNNHTSNGDDDDNQNEPKTDSRNKWRRWDAANGGKRLQCRQAAGGQAAVGVDGLLVCIKVSHSAGMQPGGPTTAGSSSGLPHFFL
jgi:hypothetical protein